LAVASPGRKDRVNVGRSARRHWNTRRGTRTTPSYAPMITPNYGPPLGIPVGVFEEDEGTVPRSLLLTAKPGSSVSLGASSVGAN